MTQWTPVVFDGVGKRWVTDGQFRWWILGKADWSIKFFRDREIARARGLKNALPQWHVEEWTPEQVDRVLIEKAIQK